MTLVKLNPAFGRPGHPLFEGKWADDFFRPFFGDRTAHSAIPAVNVLENADAFELHFAAPGLAKEDFKVSLDKDVLKVKVEKEVANTENQPTWHRREFSYTAFERSFKLPKEVNLEAITAGYEHGILKLTLPKQVEAKDQGAKEISIS